MAVAFERSWDGSRSRNSLALRGSLKVEPEAPRLGDPIPAAPARLRAALCGIWGV